MVDMLFYSIVNQFFCRIMLLEAITQLCAKRKNREVVREKNAYVILRELHKWEKDRAALLACENLVDILIRYELLLGVQKSFLVFFIIKKN